MKRMHRRAARGSSMVETLVSGALLSIGVVGTVVTVVYQQNLETSTARLWEATGEATAELETVRAASESNWANLKTNFDGRTVETKMRYHTKSSTSQLFGRDEIEINDSTGDLKLSDGREYGSGEYSLDDNGYPVVDGVRVQKAVEEGETVAGNMLQVSVIDDADQLDDGALMWAVGATAPSFYAIEVTPASADGEFGNRLRFQTYMTDHSGLSKTGATGLVDETPVVEEESGGGGGETQDTGGDESTGGGETQDTGGDTSDGTDTDDTVLEVVEFEFDEFKEAISKDATNISISGTNSEIANFTITNLSALALDVTKVKVEIKDAGDFEYAEIADVEIYSGDAIDKFDENFSLTIPSGEFDVQILADPESNGRDTPFEGAEVKVKFTFTDGSRQEVKFKP